LSSKGDRVPLPNQIGTSEERLNSVFIWYSLQRDEVFPLDVCYAQARPDQVGLQASLHLPPSELGWSMSGYLRQYPQNYNLINNDRFTLLIGQIKNFGLSDFFLDFYRYPLNPSASAFEAARLLENYIRTGDEAPLRKYLGDRGIRSLEQHSFGYYPLYELFFLLTRFASPPLNEAQVQLAQRRNSTQWNSPERRFIDAIFHLHIYNLSRTLELINRIAEEGPETVGSVFGTTYSDWVNWANEYVELEEVESQPLGYLGDSVNRTGPILYTWTDQELVDLMDQLNLTLPVRSEFLSRYDWVENIAAIIQRYRSGSAANGLYGVGPFVKNQSAEKS